MCKLYIKIGKSVNEVQSLPVESKLVQGRSLKDVQRIQTLPFTNDVRK